jgi:hypothetical protein
MPPQAPRMPAATYWQTPPVQAPAARPAPAVNAALAGNATRQPTIRAQSADAPAAAPPRLVLPTPEALGLVSNRESAVRPASTLDWNDARVRLRRVGAVGFHLDEIAPGRWRATLLLPQNDQPARHIEASADSDSAALAGVLERAEALAALR